MRVIGVSWRRLVAVTKRHDRSPPDNLLRISLAHGLAHYTGLAPRFTAKIAQNTLREFPRILAKIAQNTVPFPRDTGQPLPTLPSPLRRPLVLVVRSMRHGT